MAGFLGNDVPPGLRGILAAEGIARQRDSGNLNQAIGLLNVQNSMRQAALEEETHPLKIGLLRAQVDAANAPKISRVDMGGAIGFVDDRSGALIGQIPKSASPDAVLGDTRARDLHATPSGGQLLADRTQRELHTTPSGSAVLSANTQRQLHGTPSASAILADNRARQGTPQYDADRGIVVNPGLGTASPVLIDGQPLSPKPKDAPEALLKAAGYADRMTKAEAIISQNAASGTPGIGEAAASKIPLTGNVAANLLRGPQRQQYVQASEDWVRAKLRQESGAVIGDEEMAREIRTYFPQIGDTPQVIAQKAQARATANQAMRTAAGRAAQSENSTAAPPPVGTVRQGYRFKGGNPAEPASWERI